jgi:hypothetical protein
MVDARVLLTIVGDDGRRGDDCKPLYLNVFEPTSVSGPARRIRVAVSEDPDDVSSGCYIGPDAAMAAGMALLRYAKQFEGAS